MPRRPHRLQCGNFGDVLRRFCHPLRKIRITWSEHKGRLKRNRVSDDLFNGILKASGVGGIVFFEFEPSQAVYFATCRCSYHNKEIYGLLGNSAHCAYR